MKQKLLLTLLIVIAVFSFNNINASEDINKHSVVIYWDASLSQQDRNKTKEFEFLDSYFKTYPNTSVKLVVFNTRVVSKFNYEVVSSNWQVLKQELQKVIYNGASDFSLVNSEVACDNLLLFTDGEGNLGNLEPYLYSPPIITINSNKNSNKKFLHETAYYNRGYFVDLLELSDVNIGVQAIKSRKTLPRLQFVENTIKDKNYILGNVIDNNGFPLKDVVVSVKDKEKITLSLEDGSYKLEANPGDVLTFNYVGKKGKEVIVGEEKIINIEFSDLTNQLETVVIKKTEEKMGGQVNIGGFTKDKKKLGYDVSVIEARDLKSDNSVNLQHSLKGKIPGVYVGSDRTLDITGFSSKDVIVRGGASSIIEGDNHPTIFIDGTPMADGVVIDINPSRIKRVTVLKGLAATNRYGSIGQRGVILITTNNDFTESNTENSNTKEKVKVPYKIFDGVLKVQNDVDSNYTKMLKSFSDSNSAYQYYIDKLKNNKSDIEYFVASSSYFFTVNEKEKGEEILSNLIELYPNNLPILKVAAYHYEKNEIYEKMPFIYKRIIELAPTMSQAYLDLANSYVSNKEYQKAIDVFKKITTNGFEEVESWNGIYNQIRDDFKNLLSKRNQSWNTKNIAPEYFNKTLHDMKVVVECSTPQTEYEMQYINPKKQSSVISHTKEKAKNILQNELKEGYNSNDFTLSNMDKGLWHLNIIVPQYKIDNKNPRVIKVRIYTHYGKPNQKLQTHILNLDTIKQERLFASFTI